MPAVEDLETVLERIIVGIAPLDGFAAISLGGSTQAGLADETSDLDIHVFWAPPLASSGERAAVLEDIADAGSVHVDIHSWGLEDHFAIGGQSAELIYFRLDDLQEQVDRAYGEGLDGEAFTTSFLYTVASGRPLYDPTGALEAMRERLLGEFPEATFRQILEHRSPLLQVAINQMRRAQRRDDLLSVQQKRASFQAIYFNLLFTLNRRYHPGEKRLLIHSESCPLLPPAHVQRWEASARMDAGDPSLPTLLEGLAHDLLQLIGEGLGHIPAVVW
jgi:predicted nucleotidyltransferase